MVSVSYVRGILVAILVIFITICACGTAAAQAAPNSPAAQESATGYFTVASGDGITSTPDGLVTWTVGDVSVLAGAPIARDFTLVNFTKRDLEVDRIQSSCACTTAFVGSDATTKLPVKVAAGASTKLHVAIDPARIYPGPIKKIVWLYGPGAGANISIEVVGTLLAAATFTPANIDFGRVRAGDSHPIQVTVHVDSHTDFRAGSEGRSGFRKHDCDGRSQRLGLSGGFGKVSATRQAEWFAFSRARAAYAREHG
jgi:hypothetical protein